MWTINSITRRLGEVLIRDRLEESCLEQVPANVGDGRTKKYEKRQRVWLFPVLNSIISYILSVESVVVQHFFCHYDSFACLLLAAWDRKVWSHSFLPQCGLQPLFFLWMNWGYVIIHNWESKKWLKFGRLCGILLARLLRHFQQREIKFFSWAGIEPFPDWF